MDLKIFKNNISVYVLISTIISIAYYPLFFGEWALLTSWDDDHNFLKTDIFKGLSWEHLAAMCTAIKINVFEPLSWILKALIYSQFGLSSQVYRLASLLLHSISACLVYMINEHIVEGFLDAPGNAAIIGSIAGAVIFATHPSSVEIVGWPSCLPYALAGFFFFFGHFIVPKG